MLRHQNYISPFLSQIGFKIEVLLAILFFHVYSKTAVTLRGNIINLKEYWTHCMCLCHWLANSSVFSLSVASPPTEFDGSSSFPAVRWSRIVSVRPTVRGPDGRGGNDHLRHNGSLFKEIFKSRLRALLWTLEVMDVLTEILREGEKWSEKLSWNLIKINVFIFVLHCEVEASAL